MNFLTKRLNVGLLVFLVAAVGLSCFGLFMNDLPKGHDLSFHLARIESLSEGIRFGELPVRIYPHYFKGYGYANGLMYPDLFLYPAAFLCLTGIGVIWAYKGLILVCTILTAIFMYRTLIKITRQEWASRLGMLLYTVSLYRVVDVWTRAALGEVLAFMFIPFVLLGIYYIFFDDDRQWYELTIGFTGIFLSHLLSGAMWSSVMVVICIVFIPKMIKEPRRLWNLIKATGMTILLVSFFLFPMFEQLMDQKLKMSEDIAYYLGDSVLPLKAIFLDSKIEGHPNEWFPGGIGCSVMGIIVIGLAAQIQEIPKKLSVVAWGSVIISLVVLVMMSDIFPWYEVLKYAKVFESLQFVWRLLMIATSLLVLAFAIFYSYSKSYAKVLGILTVILSVIVGVEAQIETLRYMTKVDSSLLVREEISEYAVNDRDYPVGNSEYVPLKTNIINMYGLENRYRVNQEIEYKTKQEGTTITIEFEGQTQPDLQVEVPLLYYKGYGAKLEGRSLEVISGSNGAVSFVIPEVVGNGIVVVSYEGTTLQHITLGISIISFIAFILIVGRSKLKKI